MTPTFSLPGLRRAARRTLAATAATVLGAGAALAVTTGPARAAVGPQPGTYTGLGFDACTAPSSAAMAAWRASSPYRAVTVYFGGVDRGCDQPELTADWVATQVAAGWHLVPMYVGLQAPCLNTSKARIDPTRAAAQGLAQADDALSQAQALGLPRESVLVYDMEDYAGGDAACTTAVTTFLGAWTARLHDAGYLSGFYSSMARGVPDQVAAYGTAGYVRPDYLHFARWRLEDPTADPMIQATVSDPAIPAAHWSPKRRMKQHVGPHEETYGGYRIEIDGDFLDVAPLPATKSGDFTGNGWSDVVYREPSTGRLYLYGGNGTTLNGRLSLGSGWNAMDALLRVGNFDRSGGEDIVAREKSTGYLWLYPGTGNWFGSRVKVGSGWNGMRELTPVGDYNRDGYQDLAAVQSSTGALYLYPGRGTGFGARMLIGSGGWNGYDELNGGGDFTGDGYPDLLAREKTTGYLYLYAGRAGSLGGRTRIGSGWNSFRDAVQVGDFDRDGRPDLVAVQKSTGYLFRFRWLGTGWAASVRLGTGFGGMSPLL
ncbi:glycoside hydrolase domain-containing protein [Micromonospora auratinigra]|uniref:Repeat domain-containing protein n=1 Tax=Micromonospora auratinigra TaxID=261654 RepID=A0A1A8ZZU6_9ACTN|nr:glycoside hydrolase domain-containing protein [Micromonospora auratinigra]SBT49411.1 Repeat domain-containing protein [Micromonospora auratinigra]